MRPCVFTKCRSRAPSAISVTRSARFSIEVEGFDQSTGVEHLQRFASVGIHGIHGTAEIDLSAKLIETRQHCLAVVESIQRDAFQSHVGQTGTIGLKGGMSCSKEAGYARIGIRRMTCFDGQANKWWNCWGNGPLKA
jgi:hypothetical protein